MKLKQSLLSAGAKERARSSLFRSISGAEEEPEEHTSAPLVEKHRLELFEVQLWGTEDVIEWLRYTYDANFVSLDALYSLLFKENAIDGRMLLSLNENALEVLGIQDADHVSRICANIELLKQTKCL